MARTTTGHGRPPAPERTSSSLSPLDLPGITPGQPEAIGAFECPCDKGFRAVVHRATDGAKRDILGARDPSRGSSPCADSGRLDEPAERIDGACAGVSLQRSAVCWRIF